MDLRQLRYFVTLADALNFHRAAARLNISQPPLTVAIRKLEEELGSRLFDRESRGVRLTDAGRAALPAARAALEQAAAVGDAVRAGRMGEMGSLSVGFVGSAISAALPRIIPAFRTRYPKVELKLEEMTSVSIGEALAARRLDVGLVRLPLLQPGGLEVRVIERDHLVVALLEDHRLARRLAIDIADLAKEPLVLHHPVSVLRSVVLFACQQAGFSPRIAQDATQVQTLLSLVQSGLGISLVPANMARIAPEGVCLLPLSQPIPIEMGIASRVDADTLTRNFVAIACDAGDS
jgi:DNA-binding transcriptional LysR family regulator